MQHVEDRIENGSKASSLAVCHVWARVGDGVANTPTPHRDAIAGITGTHPASLSHELSSALSKTRSKSRACSSLKVSAVACHPEPMRFAQGKLPEGSPSVDAEMLRCAQHDKGSSA